MPTQFQTLEGDFEKVATTISEACLHLDQLEAGGAGRDALEAVLATLKGAADSLSGMAPTKQKQEAKARTPKPQRLINDATAETILAFAEKFDAAVAALAETHIPRAQALVVAAPAPEPEPVPEPVVAPTANHTHAIPALSKATEPSPPSAETPSTSTDAAPPSSLEPEHSGDIPDDPELAAALAMSMGGDAATEAAQAAVVVPESAPAADTTSTAATPALAAAPSGATSVRARMIKTGVEMDLAVPEGTDVMPVRKFRELVAAVFGIEEVGAATLIVGGKQLKDGYTLSQSGATGAQTIFVGVDPNHAPITQQTSPASAPSEPTATTTTAGPARPATAAAAEAPGKPQLVAAMVAAITRMKAATDYVSLVAAVRTVVKLLDNLVKHPGDPKYSKVKTGNVMLKTRLLSKPGGLACLEAVGFRKDSSGEFLVCEKPHKHIADVKVMLDQALARWEEK